MGKLNAREKADRAATRRRAGLQAAKTTKSRPKTPSLEQLLCPLTSAQKDGIRDALLDDAPRFLRDWDRISAVGYHYANLQRKNAQAFRKSNQKQLDQEAKAVAAGNSVASDGQPRRLQAELARSAARRTTYSYPTL